MIRLHPGIRWFVIPGFVLIACFGVAHAEDDATAALRAELQAMRQELQTLRVQLARVTLERDQLKQELAARQPANEAPAARQAQPQPAAAAPNQHDGVGRRVRFTVHRVQTIDTSEREVELGKLNEQIDEAQAEAQARRERFEALHARNVYAKRANWMSRPNNQQEVHHAFQDASNQQQTLDELVATRDQLQNEIARDRQRCRVVVILDDGHMKHIDALPKVWPSITAWKRGERYEARVFNGSVDTIQLIAPARPIDAALTVAEPTE